MVPGPCLVENSNITANDTDNPISSGAIAGIATAGGIGASMIILAICVTIGVMCCIGFSCFCFIYRKQIRDK